MTEAPTDKPASPPAREELHFDSLKEHRGVYFVRYQPPVADATFATMNVVYYKAKAALRAALANPVSDWPRFAYFNAGKLNE